MGNACVLCLKSVEGMRVRSGVHGVLPSYLFLSLIILSVPENMSPAPGRKEK